ncbi:MAG TPA: Gfo/Idh/MocA family oxidoreductase [Chloroflexota bacterium]
MAANSAAGRTLRIGLAGLGVGASNALGEAQGMRGHEHVKLVAAADPRPVARERFAQEFGGETFDDVEAMCQKAAIDAVYILTPSRLHAAHAILAAEHGKQIILDKPMGLSLDECDAVLVAVERCGVRLLVGHSQSLDAGIVRMTEIVRGGELGRPVMIESSFYSEWLYRPRSADELEAGTGEGSLVLRQGPVQVDIVRMLGGGQARSVRAMTSVVDPARPVEGSYMAYLEFADGTPATLIFNSYAHFNSAEITFGYGLGGHRVAQDTGVRARRQIREFARPEDEWAYKDATRYGGPKARGIARAGESAHQFFGFTLVSCEHGAIRQTPTGLRIYGDDAVRDVEVPAAHYSQVELDVMYQAWANDAPLAYHDGPWGRATTEVCLSILESARERREITLTRQVGLPRERGR